METTRRHEFDIDDYYRASFLESHSENNQEIMQQRGLKFVKSVTFGLLSSFVIAVVTTPCAIVGNLTRLICNLTSMIVTGCGLREASKIYARRVVKNLSFIATNVLEFVYECIRALPIVGFVVTYFLIDPIAKMARELLANRCNGVIQQNSLTAASTANVGGRDVN